MPLRSFTTSAEGRALAGVCAGIAQALGVDATLVRLIFALLALAGGAGIVLYLALWAWSSADRARAGRSSLLLVAGSAPARCARRLRPRRGWASCSSPPAWRSRCARAAASGPMRRSRTAASRSRASARSCLLQSGSAPTRLLAPGAVAGALVLVCGPLLWRLALERDAERSARIRTDERADVAARVHDSVLQTLALIQRHARRAASRRVRSRGARSASCAAGSTPRGRSATTARRSSPRSRPPRPTSRSSTASASSSRARATRRRRRRSCSPHARR